MLRLFCSKYFPCFSDALCMHVKTFSGTLVGQRLRFVAFSRKKVDFDEKYVFNLSAGHKHKIRCYKRGLAVGTLTLTPSNEGSQAAKTSTARTATTTASGSSNEAPSTGPSECGGYKDLMGGLTTSSSSGGNTSSSSNNSTGAAANRGCSYSKTFGYPQNRSSSLLGPSPHQHQQPVLPLAALAAWQLSCQEEDETEDTESIGDGLLPLPKGLKPLMAAVSLPQLAAAAAAGQHLVRPQPPVQPPQHQELPPSTFRNYVGPTVSSSSSFAPPPQRDRTKSGRKSAKSNRSTLQRRDSTTESDDNHATGNFDKCNYHFML